MNAVPDGHDLLHRALDGLAGEPVWSASCAGRDPHDPGDEMRLDLVVRPGRELMRWPTSNCAVLFEGGRAYVLGDMFRDSVIGELGTWSPEDAAAREAALGGFWIRCDEAWFRRCDRDHCPYGMLLKSIEPDAAARLGTTSVSLVDGRKIARVAPPGSSRRGPRYDVDIDADPPRVVRLEAMGELVEIRYDDHPVDWPVPAAAETLSVEEAMARVRPPRRARRRLVRVAAEVVVMPPEDGEQ